MGISRHRLARFTVLIAVGVVAALGLVDRDSSAAGLRVPNAEETSARLFANDLALRQGIDAWRAGGDPPKTPPPREVMAPARYLQSAVRSLACHPNLARNTIALLPGSLASDIRELTGAARELRELSSGCLPIT